ncbi:MAG: MFS transporter [Lentisphaerae bacterium]|nr:MFS transporter [Lentisphaerota bacterium]
MESNVLSADLLRRKKMFVLFCGIFIFFLTSMAKVLVPATIFQDLLKMNMDVTRIASLGAAFLYAYAASQLVMGCFSDRYGGVRILLIGGSMFAGGTIIFPLMENYYLMLLFRVITGFGAGTIFLGVAKLLGDLFPGKFSMALGLVLLFSYFGPTAGTVPMVKLVEVWGWQKAMILPGLAAMLPMLIIVCCMKGLIKPVSGGQTLEPLAVMVRNRKLWVACFACAAVYGTYYAMVGQIGQKIFIDTFKFSSGSAATCIMVLTVIVAVNNVVCNVILKFFGNRRKLVILLGVLLALAGVLLAKYVFFARLSGVWFMAAAVCMAFPAGFFSIFGTVAKELNDEKYTGMSVAFINFMAFVFISSYQNITGHILKMFSPAAGTPVFSVTAYQAVFSFFLIGAVISLIAALLMPETYKNNINAR